MRFDRRKILAALALAQAFVLSAPKADALPDEDGRRFGTSGRRAVFIMTNATGGNAILSFRRGEGGVLTPAGATPTGGRGSGGGLGNQGGLTISDNGRWMIAVNAGSDDITVFHVFGAQLRRVDIAPSGGRQPVSVTIDDDLVYVVNAGSDSIAGFRLNGFGRLTRLPDSLRPLSASGTAPAQIEFSPSGRELVITEKATNRITIYPVDYFGRPARTPTVVASPGQTPFGFAFAGRRNLIVSEAAGGAPNASSLSSYRLKRDGTLEVLQAKAATNQTAACWVVTSRDRRFAYTTNTGSDTISAFQVEEDDTLTLLNANGVAARAVGGPIDMAVTRGGRYLFTLNGAGRSISSFLIGEDGSLTPGAVTTGLPAGANGLVAR